MKDLLSVFLMVLLLAMSTAAVAGKEGDAEGVVNKVKISAQKISVTHGPIEGLGMAAMTMDFNVYDPAMLEDVKAGQKIAFTVEAQGSNYVITDLEVVGEGDITMDDGADHSNHHNH